MKRTFPLIVVFLPREFKQYEEGTLMSKCSPIENSACATACPCLSRQVNTSRKFAMLALGAFARG